MPKLPRSQASRSRKSTAEFIYLVVEDWFVDAQFLHQLYQDPTSNNDELVDRLGFWHRADTDIESHSVSRDF